MFKKKTIKLHKRSQTRKGYKYDSKNVNFKDRENKSMLTEIRIMMVYVWEGQ